MAEIPLSGRDTLKLAGAGALAVAPGPEDVFIVVDVQNDFLPGGALAVKDGDQVIAPINALAKKFINIVQTQDWHTRAIARSRPRMARSRSKPSTSPMATQVLWPDHCVQGSQGAAFSDKLDLPTAQLVIRKGYHPQVDSYSAFLEADKTTRTGLAGYLKERGIKRCFVAGLATDFCVAWTAMDARSAGLDVYMIEDASRGIDANGSLAAALKAMDAAGVKRVQSAAILGA